MSESTLADVDILLVNEHGELTEGTRTNLMVQMGGEVWLTPPVESGLLPGVFREHLLRTGEAVEATMTVTLAAPKIPLVFPPADSRAGDLVIADIGIPPPVLDELEGPHLELLTRERMQGILPTRAAESHKGDFGRVLIIAGSFGRTGAAHLAALGALRSGAGLVTVATPRSCLPILASMGAEYMTLPLEETPAGTVDFAALERILELINTKGYARVVDIAQGLKISQASVTNMVSSEPLKAPQMPTAVGSVASEPVRKLKLRPVRTAPRCSSER